MGLDITAYKKLEVVENPKVDENGKLESCQNKWNPGTSMEWSEEHFPGRGEGINPELTYSFKEEFSFRAGSYSSYGWWRYLLATFANQSGPSDDFSELINFADNEGVIGTVASIKLSIDFEKNKERAKEYSKTIEDGDWWLSLYETWEEAFIMDSDNGAVSFC